MNKLLNFNEFLNESVDYLNVVFFMASDKKWYIEIGDEINNEINYKGSFVSFRTAKSWFNDNYPNPGSFIEDDSGSHKPPKKYDKK